MKKKKKKFDQEEYFTKEEIELIEKISDELTEYVNSQEFQNMLNNPLEKIEELENEDEYVVFD